MTSMFDCIIPIGETCNITFLLQNCKLKKQTSLFEWFVSNNLKTITSVLVKIGQNTDTDIVKDGGYHTYIENNTIFSGHYKYSEFKEIYIRRRNRLIETILNNNRLLFVRFEGSHILYETSDIDEFINSIKHINPSCDVKLLLISPNEKEIEHPSLISAFYDKQSSDPYCRGKEINDFFINTLQSIGYNIHNTFENTFTDLSEV